MSFSYKGLKIMPNLNNFYAKIVINFIQDVISSSNKVVIHVVQFGLNITTKDNTSLALEMPNATYSAIWDSNIASVQTL
jgi:hypothetical protein